MHKMVILGCCLVVAIVVAIVLWQSNKKTLFYVESDDVKPNQMLDIAQVYNQNGCLGKNISPQLAWKNAPKGTKSFAIICHDPDAPHENGWYHWLVVGIPASVSEIKAGEKISEALETVTSYNQNAYGGACPPVGHGLHHYNFTVYALDVDKLEVKPQTPPTIVEKVVKSHALAQATLTGVYERK